MNKNTMTIC